MHPPAVIVWQRELHTREWSSPIDKKLPSTILGYHADNHRGRASPVGSYLQSICSYRSFDDMTSTIRAGCDVHLGLHTKVPKPTSYVCATAPRVKLNRRECYISKRSEIPI
jgi:hypothetical protein